MASSATASPMFLMNALRCSGAVTGIQQFVMSYEVGGALEDSQWQAPAHCFPVDTDDQQENRAKGRHCRSEEDVAVGLKSVKLLKKLAGGAIAF
jgi:hypothetical protein